MSIRYDLISERVKQELLQAEPGHDWLHIERVYKTAMVIANTIPSCNIDTIRLAALLHDIADPKFHHGNEEIGPNKAREIMATYEIAPSIMFDVVQIIRNMSFKNSFDTKSFDAIELDIVQDADRLDAIGAIGIARAFSYGGAKNRTMYDSSNTVKVFETKEEYKNNTGPTINHFYEKLLKLKGLMKTKKGIELAQERHIFMEEFLVRFHEECAVDNPFSFHN